MGGTRGPRRVALLSTEFGAVDELRGRAYDRRVEALVDDWPVWLVFAVLWLGAFAGGTPTYWVGRGVRAGGSRSRWAGHLDGRDGQRAEGWVRRFGAPAVDARRSSPSASRPPSTPRPACSGCRSAAFLPAVTLGCGGSGRSVYTTVGFTVRRRLARRPSWRWAVVAVGVVARSCRLVARPRGPTR